MVDIRPDNLRDVLRVHILAGESGALRYPVMKGSASSLLVVRPVLYLDGEPAGDEAFMRDLQQQLAQPIEAMNQAMVAFTSQQGNLLDLELPLAWESLPMLSEQQSLTLTASWQVQTLNAGPQAKVPLPATAGLLLGGMLLLAVSGSVAIRCEGTTCGCLSEHKSGGRTSCRM